MEGCEKWLSPSKSTTSPKPSSAGENDENDSSQDKMIFKFQNQKKSASKHFMSPTISAASKAAPQRKKILSERNENLSSPNAHNHKTPILGKKKSPRNSNWASPRLSFSGCAASETDDDWDTEFTDNSSVKAYDPLKNYLSPRPKYLRFNPNRRREIFNRLENEELNEEIHDPRENEENIKIKENDEEGYETSICNDSEEEDEELEEEIEERGWCYRELIKLVLILIACVLSTSYICTMNLQSPTTTQQAFWKVKNGCVVIKRQTLEMIGMQMHEDGFLKVEGGDDYGEFEADYNGEIFGDDGGDLKMVEIYKDENRETGKGVVKVEVSENDVENLEGADNGENETSVDAEIIEDGVGIVDEVEIDKDKNREIEEIVKVEIVEKDFKNLEKVENGVGGIGESRYGQNEVKDENFDRLVKAKANGGANTGSFWLETETEEPGSSSNEANVEIIEPGSSSNEANVEIIEPSTEKTDETETKGPHEQSTNSAQYEVKDENFDRLVEAKANEGANTGSFFLEKETEEPCSSSNEANVEKIEPSTEKTEETETKGRHEQSTSSGLEVENEKVGRKKSVVIGFFLISIILALLAIIVDRLRKKPRSALAEKSEPVLKPHKLAAVEEKKRIEFVAKPSVAHPMQESPKKLVQHHICAPTVELIGEIDVGIVSSRRIRKYEAEREESSADYLPKCGTSTQPISARRHQSSRHEHSNISSSSYTTETKKEGGGQSGECTTGVTPVRRSSRLRSRVTSP